MTNFHVGQLVVCVKRGKWQTDVGCLVDESGPVNGRVYEVSDKLPALFYGYPMIRVDKFEHWYDPRQFRPVANQDGFKMLDRIRQAPNSYDLLERAE